MNENEKSKEAEEKEPDIVIPIWEGEYVKLSIVADLPKEKKK